MKIAKLLAVVGVASFLFASGIARAAHVTSNIPIVAVDRINGAPHMPLANLIDGIGFTGDSYDPSINFGDTQWRAHYPSESSSNVQLVFDVGSVQDIAEMAVWNYAEGGGSYSGDRGTKNFTLSYSSDNVNYTSLGTQTLSRLEMLGFSPSSQHDVIALGVSAQYVKMSFDDPANLNYGDTSWWGLNEVRFGSSPVPEPGTLVVASGLIGLCYSLRKRLGCWLR